MDSLSTPAEEPPQVVFRGKKRKTYRQRPGAEADEDGGATTHPIGPVNDAVNVTARTPASIPDPVTTPTDNEQGEALSIREALRLRNARKSRLRGVAFGVDGAVQLPGAVGGEDELSQMIREEQKKAMEQAVVAPSKRFAPQTGLSGEIINKHITDGAREEYIEAELAKRHYLASNSQGSSSSNQPGGSGDGAATAHGGESSAAVGKGEQKHTALTGKLFEVDLGDEVRSRNEAMTDRARRKLQGLAVEDEESAEQQRRKKVRLGKDGKPWRPRNRRTSDDVKRDQLVEEILRENRLDVYEAPTPPSGAANAGEEDEELAADDRIAEEFRREFLDAMAERQRRRKPAGPPSSKPGAKKDEDVLKGPKLGGSRNTRAAMRDLLLQKEKEKDGKRR